MNFARLDTGMDIPKRFNRGPFPQLLGIEVTSAENGHATGVLPFTEEISSSPDGSVAHGGATYALADTVGGAAAVSLARRVTPTVDMRIDYLSPMTSDVYADAEVIRFGSNLAMVRVEMHDDDGNKVATAHGTYKSSGQGDETLWEPDSPDEHTD